MKNNTSLGSTEISSHIEANQPKLKETYEPPRVLSDQVFVSLSCTGPPNFNEGAFCSCP